MVDDRRGRSSERRPQSGSNGAPRRSGPGRARPAQPRDDATAGPPIPADIEARQLAPDVRRELSTLDRATADAVARHLVAAGGL
ncbi:MAG: tetratricopeptide repeat protein, partial [Mycobacteriaceae bacterium]|nr:tetratricopeptide repeat protein [Mycobacteriaceae bacterium]